MKKLLFIITTMITLTSYAEMRSEFDLPTEKKCHQEIKTLGCIKSGDQESQACTELAKKKLSVSCRSLHEARKQK